MKRRAALLLLVGVYAVTQLFSGCSGEGTGSGSKAGSDTDVFLPQDRIAVGAGGVVSCFHGLLTYSDYKAQKTVVLCNKPNCKHEKGTALAPTECSARNPTGGDISFALFYGGHLYSAWGSALNKTTLYIADLDGSNRRKLCELDCQCHIPYAANMTIVGGVLYLQGEEQTPEVDEKGTNNHLSVFPYAIDLKTGKSKRLAKPIKEENPVITNLYCLGNQLYYLDNWLDSSFNYLDADQSDSNGNLLAEEHYHGELRVVDLATQKEKVLKTFRLETQEHSFSGDFLYYNAGTQSGRKVLRVYNLRTGEDKALMDIPDCINYTIVNDELLCGNKSNDSLYSLSSGRKLAEYPHVFSNGIIISPEYKIGSAYLVICYSGKDGKGIGAGYINKNDLYNGIPKVTYCYRYEQEQK